MAELEDLLNNIQAILEEANDLLPNVRYNTEMLTFLCHEVQKVAHILRMSSEMHQKMRLKMGSKS